MTFTNRLRAGDTISGTKLTENFANLDSAITGIDRERIVPGAIMLRHRQHVTASGVAGSTYATEPWKILEWSTNAGPVGAGVGVKIVPSGTPTWDRTSGKLIAVTLGCEVEAGGGALNNHIFEVKIAGSTVRTQHVSMDPGERKMFTTHWWFIPPATPGLIELWATEAGGNGTYTNGFIYTMAFKN